MAREIERKFLVKNDAWRKQAGPGVPYRQGYLSTDPARSVRVRVAGDEAFVTIKGRSAGAARDEFEYPIPREDAEQMLENLCIKPLIEKTRYVIREGPLKWEIDEFAGENQGLVIAEMEIPEESTEIEKPGWVGDDVTGDPRYYNINLVYEPFRRRGMAYHLKAGESVPAEIKRIVREQIDAAVRELSGRRNGNRDEAIHEARKRIKKIRAAMRLVQSELGDTYRIENARFRSVARRLTEFRDAGSIIEIFDHLRDKYKDDLVDGSLESIRKALIARKEEAEQRANIDKVLDELADDLRAASKRVKAWPLQTDGFPAIAPGLEGVFRKGRNALALVRKHPDPVRHHDWRKRVKDHWYHVRLLEDVWIDVLEGYEKSLKELETWLGDDHNLAVLRDTIVGNPNAFGSDKVVNLCLDLIDKYQKELRDDAASQGERIYDESPTHLTTRMKHLWTTWQTRPKSLEELEKVQSGH